MVLHSVINLKTSSTWLRVRNAMCNMLVPQVTILKLVSATKSSVITKKRVCEVAIHFNKEPYALADFKFVIIEQLCNLGVNNYSIDDRLLTTEAFWCVQLCTLAPHQLNKRCEFNSTNRIR